MPIKCRKNQATLSAAEKLRFVNAVRALKASGKYDQYVLMHMNAMATAHRGPTFLPWHREFLRRYEADLQAIDPSIMLPYWDWTTDNSATSSIWGPDFMGGNGRATDGRVQDGPFAFSTGAWALAYDGPALRRRFAVGVPTLPTTGDVANLNLENIYDEAPYDTSSSAGFRNRLEGWIAGPQLHNRVHVWIGGSMAPASSPNDPVFFLHHCFIDKLWADWQAANPSVPYLPDATVLMAPWNTATDRVTPANVLDHQALGYAYDTEGVCQSVGTVKFRDDIKFGGDTLKFRDDGTVKFRDDIKFGGDTVKFRDDGTVKFRDDGTVKFRDDGTVKFRDDIAVKGPQDAANPPSRAGDPAAPFLLSTPHHSTAWAHSFPDAFQAALDGTQQQLAELASQLQAADAEGRAGRLSESDKAAVDEMRSSYHELLTEYHRMLDEAQHGPR